MKKFAAWLGASPWLIIAAAVVTMSEFGQLIFAGVKGMTMEWVSVLTKLALLGIIYVLQVSVRDLSRKLRLKRVVDSYVYLYRAEILYQGRTQFATDKARMDDLNRHLQAELTAVQNAIRHEHPELSNKEVDEALTEHYGRLIGA